ncbi:MAG: SMC-Scp complex subunit ScpB [Elusimicrobia bacterium]|nr:SMC-Scp complex subunit ScpB [Elusimicrobiota bacterium]
METEELKKHIEAILFISGKTVKKRKLAELTGASEKQIAEAAECLQNEWNSNHGIILEEIGGGWQFSTKPEYADYVLKLYPWKGNLKLSKSAAEVLSIILYKQPVTKAEINAIRGIDSQGPIATLLKNSLIKTSGRKNVPGKPRLFRVSENFYHIFGIKDETDIPSWDEMEEE